MKLAVTKDENDKLTEVLCPICRSELWCIENASDILIGLAPLYCKNCDKIISYTFIPMDESFPTSCSSCPYVIWESKFKYCNLIRQELHPYFRLNAKLHKCPLLKGENTNESK